jgi:hypothetical protein
MKAQPALMAAAIIFAPAIASAQPVQTPPADKNATQAQDQAKPDNATADAATTKATCDTSGKTTEAKAHDPSAKVGKDTGTLPPPRKKKDADSDCAAQPK